MRKERVEFAELNVSKGSKQQQKRPQASESSTSAIEEGITLMELNLSGASRENPGNGKGRHCKGNFSWSSIYIIVWNVQLWKYGEGVGDLWVKILICEDQNVGQVSLASMKSDD